mmetsp:Transcript_13872/g.20228  ORF Transcript_13872/g.20228 Transcript_13872/m.20228 type:complete len:197 (-) Transcript_13872:46-636(-)
MRFVLVLVSLFHLHAITNFTGVHAENCTLECFHAGQCKQHALTGQNYCDCPSGFQGIHCEEPYITCSDNDSRSWRCMNGGLCAPDTLGCNCLPEFEGKFCDIYTGPCVQDDGVLLMGIECLPSRQEDKRSISVGIVVLGIILSFLIGGLSFYLGRIVERKSMQRNRTPMTSPAVEEGKGQGTMNDGVESVDLKIIT